MIAALTATPRRRLLLALAALLVFSLAFQGRRGLWEPDEGRYGAVALQALRDGDWATPHLNARLPHFSKPPLTTWALAGSMAVFGEREWALRLPNALAFAGTVLAVWALGRRLVPARPALAPVVQATSLLPFVAANVVTTDTLLALWETLGVLGFVAAVWDEPRRRWGAPLMGAAFGLAMLTKGPVGLLPVPALLAFLLWSEGWRALRRLASPLGLALFLALGCGWLAFAAGAHPGLLSYWLGGELLGRATGALRSPSHLGGVLRAYGPVVLAGALPWSLVWLGLRWRRAGRPPAPEPAARRAGLLLGLWLALPLAVFLLAPSRLPFYLLPLSVPCSLLLARALAPRLPRSRAGAALLAVWVAVLLLLRLGSGWYPNRARDGRWFAERVREIATRDPSAPPPDVAVFVDALPRWSLAFYLGCEVDSADLLLDRGERAGPQYAPVHGELAPALAARRRTLFLVAAPSEEAFRREAEAASRSLTSLGRVLDLGLYADSPRGGEPATMPHAAARPPIG